MKLKNLILIQNEVMAHFDEAEIDEINGKMMVLVGL